MFRRRKLSYRPGGRAKARDRHAPGNGRYPKRYAAAHRDSRSQDGRLAARRVDDGIDGDSWCAALGLWVLRGLLVDDYREHAGDRHSYGP